MVVLRVVGKIGLLVGLVACSAADAPPADAPADEPGAGEVSPGEAPSPSEVDPGGPSDDDPDRDADPDAPSPEDDPPTRAELVETFAPHVHLHPDDTNRPANVDWYLARVSMRFHHDNCPDHELLPKGKVTQASLVAQSHEDNKSLCRHDGAKLVKSTTSDHFFLEVADSATYAGAPRSEWKTYVVWRPHDKGGLVDVEYWFFYPYNDNIAMFNHESDWEHVRVTLDPKANGGHGEAVEVKMSAHHGGTIMKIGDARLTMEGGTHPVAYSAKGTHANYPEPGTYDIEGTKGIAKDKASPAADVWKTEAALVHIGTRKKPKNGQLFVKYWGRWGELGDLPETNGVTRHFP